MSNAIWILKWLGIAVVLALALGYTVGKFKTNAAVLAIAEKDRDMLLACLNRQGAFVSDTGAKVETTTCGTKTVITVRKVVAGL